MNLWKPHFTQNLYKPMKVDKFVMYLHIYLLPMYVRKYNQLTYLPFFS
jgi:hypothetical protein